MSKSTQGAKVPALKLTLGHAPNTWHVLPGVGYVHPEIPSPVGGSREVSLERATELADGPTRVELVEITETEAEKARKQRAQARGETVAAVRELRRAGRAHRSDIDKAKSDLAAAAREEA